MPQRVWPLPGRPGHVSLLGFHLARPTRPSPALPCHALPLPCPVLSCRPAKSYFCTPRPSSDQTQNTDTQTHHANTKARDDEMDNPNLQTSRHLLQPKTGACLDAPPKKVMSSPRARQQGKAGQGRAVSTYVLGCHWADGRQISSIILIYRSINISTRAISKTRWWWWW